VLQQAFPVLLPLVCEPYSSTHPVKIETPERIDACVPLIIEISLGIAIENKKEKEKEKEKLGLQVLDAPPDLTLEIERNPQGTFTEVHVTRSIPLWFRSYGLLSTIKHFKKWHPEDLRMMATVNFPFSRKKFVQGLHVTSICVPVWI
jgi:hypothetical protein